MVYDIAGVSKLYYYSNMIRNTTISILNCIYVVYIYDIRELVIRLLSFLFFLLSQRLTVNISVDGSIFTNDLFQFLALVIRLNAASDSVT